MTNKASGEAQSTSRRFLWLLVSIAILGAGIGGFVFLSGLREEPGQQEETAAVPAVETVPLTYRQSPLRVEGNGIVSPRAEVTLSPQVSGEVVEVHSGLVTGGSFSRGETIVRIDPRSYQAALDQAKAQKASFEANLGYLEKRISRVRSLREEGYVPEDSLDELISRRDQARADIDRQEAVIRSRSLDLERTRIKAPFAGRVLADNVDVGDIVSPGTELARIYASDAVEIVVSLAADEASFIPGLWRPARDNPGRPPARIRAEHSGRQYEWDGRVDRVEADIDRDTRTVDVVVRVPDPYQPGRPAGEGGASVTADPPPLLVGMYTTVNIQGMQLPEHFVLPIDAVREGDTLWTMDHENRLQVESVEFVRQEGDRAVLLAPRLSPGTRIIVSDIAVVSDGMQVREQETRR